MTSTPDFIEDDGGRQAAGFKGKAGDCVTRAIAIATERPYLEVYNRLGEMVEEWSQGRSRQAKAWRAKGRGATARNGTPGPVCERYMREETDWVKVPMKAIGGRATADEIWAQLPPGRLVLQQARHWVALVDGVIHDIWDSNQSRWGDTKRTVYAYWHAPEQS